jgi:hypothetical protein
MADKIEIPSGSEAACIISELIQLHREYITAPTFAVREDRQRDAAWRAFDLIDLVEIT